MIRIKKVTKTIYRVEQLIKGGGRKAYFPLFTISRKRDKNGFFWKSDYNNKV